MMLPQLTGFNVTESGLALPFVVGVSGRSKPASQGRIKTSQFEVK
jgi:hypothetical protein